MKTVRVIERSKDKHGKLTGTYNKNPLINTMVYDVKFPDGAIHEYAANAIAENMYAQVDADGLSYDILNEIIAFDKDDTKPVLMKDKYVLTKSGQKPMITSTKGWKLLVSWKNGTKEWIPFSIMETSNPIEVAEFSIAHNIDKEPDFSL